jgi:hypothetical protein
MRPTTCWESTSVRIPAAFIGAFVNGQEKRALLLVEQ